eukprot:scaffold34935_cov44-Prasinocladus_malaysianus.AAC.2
MWRNELKPTDWYGALADEKTLSGRLQVDPISLHLAFDYAEHDLYEMIKFHRDRLNLQPLHAYVIKSIMWQ